MSRCKDTLDALGEIRCELYDGHTGAHEADTDWWDRAKELERQLVESEKSNELLGYIAVPMLRAVFEQGARHFVAWVLTLPTGEGNSEETWHFEARREHGREVTERLIEVEKDLKEARAAIRAAIEEEREACLKICDIFTYTDDAKRAIARRGDS